MRSDNITFFYERRPWIIPTRFPQHLIYEVRVKYKIKRVPENFTTKSQRKNFAFLYLRDFVVKK